MSDETIVSPNDKQWSVNQRYWCVKRFFEFGSYEKINAQFMHAFVTTKAPSKRQIHHWKSHFEKFGTLDNLNG